MKAHPCTRGLQFTSAREYLLHLRGEVGSTPSYCYLNQENQSPLLYAEDDENDVFLMQRALKKAGVARPLQVVRDGLQAIKYLAGEGEFADREQYPLPSILLVDLKMPRRSGLEVLQWVRTQEALQHLPVVVLTSSNQDRDMEAAVAGGASAYWVKPADPEKLIAMVSSLSDFSEANRHCPRRWRDRVAEQANRPI